MRLTPFRAMASRTRTAASTFASTSTATLSSEVAGTVAETRCRTVWTPSERAASRSTR